MRTRLMKIICLLGILVPVSGSAQENVQKAFKDFLKNSSVEYSETHSLQKDSETGVKESQCDIYRFSIPASKFGLIENIMKAFRSDENKAYTMSEGRADKNDAQIQVAVGNGTYGSVTINPRGYDYYYAAYLAPKSEDKTGNYRYIYAINWKKSKDKVDGELIVTYATTLKYRQRALTPLQGYSIGSSGENWFTTMVGYIQMLSNEGSNSGGKQVLAAKIFKQAQLSQSLNGISDDDKNAARELIKTMISDTSSHDQLVRQLLKSSIDAIK